MIESEAKWRNLLIKALEEEGIPYHKEMPTKDLQDLMYIPQRYSNKIHRRDWFAALGAVAGLIIIQNLPGAFMGLGIGYLVGAILNDVGR